MTKARYNGQKKAPTTHRVSDASNLLDLAMRGVLVQDECLVVPRLDGDPVFGFGEEAATHKKSTECTGPCTNFTYSCSARKSPQVFFRAER